MSAAAATAPSALSDKEYVSFRSSVPLKIISVGEGIQPVDWAIFDFGPRSVKCPLVLLPPACGNADIFYKQIVTLSAQGIRVISVNYPALWSIDSWVNNFSKLLDSLDIVQVHLFGASLGGFLAQKFAEATHTAQRVQSLILCNSFTDTAFFDSILHPVFPYMPLFVLQRMLMGNLPQGAVEACQATAMDFVVEQIETISRDALASRLCLNTESSYVEPQKIFLQNIKVMVVDVFDQTALSAQVKEEMAKMYPEARVAHLKSGGNFPYLSHSDEVNMFIKLHLRAFQGTPMSAGDDLPVLAPVATAAAPAATTTAAASMSSPQATAGTAPAQPSVVASSASPSSFSAARSADQRPAAKATAAPVVAATKPKGVPIPAAPRSTLPKALTSTSVMPIGTAADTSSDEEY